MNTDFYKQQNILVSRWDYKLFIEGKKHNKWDSQPRPCADVNGEWTSLYGRICSGITLWYDTIRKEMQTAKTDNETSVWYTTRPFVRTTQLTNDSSIKQDVNTKQRDRVNKAQGLDKKSECDYLLWFTVQQLSALWGTESVKCVV